MEKKYEELQELVEKYPKRTIEILSETNGNEIDPEVPRLDTGEVLMGKSKTIEMEDRFVEVRNYIKNRK